jgi:hypothetical protein
MHLWWWLLLRWGISFARLQAVRMAHLSAQRRAALGAPLQPLQPMPSRAYAAGVYREVVYGRPLQPGSEVAQHQGHSAPTAGQPWTSSEGSGIAGSLAVPSPPAGLVVGFANVGEGSAAQHSASRPSPSASLWLGPGVVLAHIPRELQVEGLPGQHTDQKPLSPSSSPMPEPGCSRLAARFLGIVADAVRFAEAAAAAAEASRQPRLPRAAAAETAGAQVHSARHATGGGRPTLRPGSAGSVTCDREQPARPELLPAAAASREAAAMAALSFRGFGPREVANVAWAAAQLAWQVRLASGPVARSGPCRHDRGSVQRHGS